jgi:hypothetical protein
LSTRFDSVYPRHELAPVWSGPLGVHGQAAALTVWAGVSMFELYRLR